MTASGTRLVLHVGEYWPDAICGYGSGSGNGEQLAFVGDGGEMRFKGSLSEVQGLSPLSR